MIIIWQHDNNDFCHRQRYNTKRTGWDSEDEICIWAGDCKVGDQVGRQDCKDVWRTEKGY